MYCGRLILVLQPFIALLVSFTLATHIHAQQTITEDFQGGSLASIDPFFEFTFDEPAEAGILNFAGNRALFLSTARNPNQSASITFDLDPGQFVEDVSIDLADNSGSGPETSVRFVGTLGTALLSTDASSFGQPLETFSTLGLGLGTIQSIELLPSLESSYDNLVASVVLEPSSITIGTFAFISLAMRKRILFRE